MISKETWPTMRDSLLNEVAARRDHVVRITITDHLHPIEVRFDSDVYFLWNDGTQLPFQV